MRFLNGLEPAFDLTYDDVFMVPARSSVTSRMDVDLSCSDGSGNTIPIVVANMTAVSGRRMAETVSRRGGLSVIPQDIPTDVVGDVVAFVKSRHLVHDTAITVDPVETVGAALTLLQKRAHGAAVVVDERHQPIGLVTEADLSGVDRFTQVRDVMSRDVVTIGADESAEDAFSRLSTARHRLAPAVDADGRLVGILTRQGALRATVYRPNVDEHDRLRVAAAVGINGDVVGQGQGARGGRHRPARRRYRARPPGEDARDAACRPGPRPRDPDLSRAMSLRHKGFGTLSRRARTS